MQDEVPWLDQLKQMPKVRIDSHGFPESFALTETDREYFNIIKTEDGHSGFYKSDPTSADKNPQQQHIEHNLLETNKEKIDSKHPSFRYHIVRSKNSKPIVGIYIPLDRN